MTRFLTSLLVSTVLFTVSVVSARAAETSTTESDDYVAGTHALDQQRWTDAVVDFDRVVGSRGRKADAALYWKAYALNKLDRTSLVAATCAQLRSSYAGSSWNRDCGALTISRGGPPSGDHGALAGDMETHDPDADLKVLALNALMNRDPAQAMPYLRDLLSGNASPAIEHRALSLLAMSNAPEAQSLLRDVVTGRLNPTLQPAAIQMYGIFHGKRGNDTLAEVYRGSADPTVKRAIVGAFFVSGDATRMVELARNEKNIEVKRTIVTQLALMQDKAATDYMIELLK